MRRALVLVLLIGCKHPAVAPPPPHHEVARETHIATPTTDPVPEERNDAKLVVGTGDWRVSVYDDGFVVWEGFSRVQSIGERHGRLDADTLAAIDDDFRSAKFSTWEAPEVVESSCDSPLDELAWWGTGDDQGNDLEGLGCDPEPEVVDLVSRVSVAIGLDQWIHGNPPSPAGQLPDGDHFVATVFRTICFGHCPSYRVSLYDDGTLVWEGGDNVERAGDLVTTLPPETVAAVVAAFDQAKFLDQPEIPTTCTDTPHTVIRYHHGDDWKGIDDPNCDATPIDDLEQQLTWLLIGDETWVATPQPVITLERTNCKTGDCKAFTVTLYDNGRLVWNGTSDVASLGEQRAWLLWRERQPIVQAFDDAKFFDLVPHTDDAVKLCKQDRKGKETCTTHACKDDGYEHVKVTYWDGTQTKTLEDNGCDFTTALGSLEDLIFRQPQVAAWIGAWT